MTALVMFFLLLAAATLQTVLPGPASLGGAKAPLLLAVVLYYALNRDAGMALLAACAAGFLQDALSPVPLGYSAFCFGLVAWVVGRFRDTVLTEETVTQVVFGAVGSAAVSLALYGLLTGADLLDVSFRAALVKTAGAAALGAVAAPAVCRFAGRLDRLVGNVRAAQTEVEFHGLG